MKRSMMERILPNLAKRFSQSSWGLGGENKTYPHSQWGWFIYSTCKTGYFSRANTPYISERVDPSIITNSRISP